MCPFSPLLSAVAVEVLDSEMEEKEGVDIISSKTQNLRKSTHKIVQLVGRISQVGNCLQDNIKTLKLYHELVTSKSVNVIKKKQLNKRKPQR